MINSYIKDDLINNFYFQVFNYTDFCNCKIIPLLKSYCSLEGNAISEEEHCYFSSEWQDYGLKYFGEEKVLFDFQKPAVDENKQIIISYQEFYHIVYKWYIEYANQYPEEKDEILNLLKQLKVSLNVMD